MSEYNLDIHQSTRRRTLLHRLWTDYVAQYLWWVVLAVFLMSIEGATLGALSYMIQPMFDDVFVPGNASGLAGVALIIFLVFAARALSGFFQRTIIVSVGLYVITSMQKQLLSHLVRLDTSFFSKHSPGGLIERVRGDTEALKNFASKSLMNIGRDAFSLISLIVVALLVDWQWTLIAFVGAPALVVPIVLTQRWILSTTRKARSRSADMSTRLDEIFHGINAIKLYNLERHEAERFKGETDRFLSNQRRAEIGKASMPCMIDLIAGLGFVAVVIFGGQEIVSGDKTVGQFMSFFTAMALMFDPLRRLSNIAGALQAAMASLERIYGVFDAKPTIVNAPELVPLPEDISHQDIVFDNVAFSYGESQVLQGLSFKAEAGKVTALVGSSGAGKSTVFNILARLVEPQSGGVTIGGTNINQFDLKELRRTMAVVSQESALFDETIETNIALGDLEADHDAVQSAADDALVSNYTQHLTEGLETLAGPRGSNLSGGQRQRVVIARALLRNAPILLMDEATSALDTRTEKLIQSTLDKVAKGKTTIVIAHRLSTVANADVIHVLDKGQVVESGSHEALLARKGAYFRLHETLER